MAAQTTAHDDLEAVRMIVEALKPFALDDQRRILRWAQEKTGHPVGAVAAPLLPGQPAAQGPEVPAMLPGGGARDIRTFLQEKRPGSDVQLATAVAYYFTFEAPPAARKNQITAAELQDSARKAGRAVLTNPTQTLHNATRLGYLDKGTERGTFRVNTVGENLVAMAMPGENADAASRKRPGRKTGAKTPKAGRKPTRSRTK